MARTEQAPSDAYDAVLGVILRKADWRLRVALMVARPLIFPLIRAIIYRAADRGLVERKNLKRMDALAERIVYPSPATRPSKRKKIVLGTFDAYPRA